VVEPLKNAKNNVFQENKKSRIMGARKQMYFIGAFKIMCENL